MTEIEFFKSFNEAEFENISNENGFTYWWATDLMKLLGYESLNSFQKAINKAMTTCNTLNIQIMENFIQEKREIENKNIIDFKLSRFACYLTVMNSDSKKPNVAKAQGYFANLAGAVHNYLLEAEKVARLEIRAELSDRENSLKGVVNKAGIEEYGLFQNAGYRGMYNKNINQLKQNRNIESKKSLPEFMGKEELAANLFRLTQTEIKINNELIEGQRNLENAAFGVGKDVREAMIKISKVAPEDLPKHPSILEVKKEIKDKRNELKKIDTKKK